MKDRMCITLTIPIQPNSTGLLNQGSALLTGAPWYRLTVKGDWTVRDDTYVIGSNKIVANEANYEADNVVDFASFKARKIGGGSSNVSTESLRLAA